MPRLLPALAAALCIASLAWGAPQGFGTGVAGQAAVLPHEDSKSRGNPTSLI